ncbi:MAG: hypothetical protein EOO53_01885 [Gammaproteobacteria bacterium]|nr:MAG: hypothetical protein EOO53_01885 [Gammaproteobacteria bacterium]
MEVVKGFVGMACSEGQVVMTSSGRLTTPFPTLKWGSNRIATNTIRRVDLWLVLNAALEAEARGGKFNARPFRTGAENARQITQADKDCAEYYLFGVQPEVYPPLLKTLIPDQGSDE